RLLAPSRGRDMPRTRSQLPKGEYRTSPGRSVAALCVGAVVGAALYAAEYVTSVLEAFGIGYVWQYGMNTAVMIFVVALVVWIAGLALAGAPVWWLLHRLGWRQWPVAMALGAILTFLVSLGIATRGFGIIPSPLSEGSYFADSGGKTEVNGELTAH